MELEFDILGNTIQIPSNAVAIKQPIGFTKEWFVPTISVIIGIGNDNTAELTMAVDDWEALKSGEKIHIRTI